MQKQRCHHPRIERWLTEPAPVAAGDRGEIKLLAHQRHNQAREVVLGHVVLHARRQKLGLIHLPGAKYLAHNPAKNQTRPHLTSDYSDKLLARSAALMARLSVRVKIRVHEALRITPAMQLGVTDHIWSIGELIEAALDGVTPEPQGHMLGRFAVIDAGNK